MAHLGPPIIGPCHDALTVLTPAMIFIICLSQDSLCVVTRVQLARLIILLVVRSTISPHQPQSMPGQIMPLRTATAEHRLTKHAPRPPRPWPRIEKFVRNLRFRIFLQPYSPTVYLECRMDQKSNNVRILCFFSISYQGPV